MPCSVRPRRWRRQPSGGRTASWTGSSTPWLSPYAVVPPRVRCPDVVNGDRNGAMSRYAQAAAAAVAAGSSSGEFTLEATEQAVTDRLQGMEIDMSAMAVVSNVYRAANALRNHLERTV